MKRADVRLRRRARGRPRAELHDNDRFREGARRGRCNWRRGGGGGAAAAAAAPGAPGDDADASDSDGDDAALRAELAGGATARSADGDGGGGVEIRLVLAAPRTVRSGASARGRGACAHLRCVLWTPNAIPGDATEWPAEADLCARRRASAPTSARRGRGRARGRRASCAAASRRARSRRRQRTRRDGAACKKPHAAMAASWVGNCKCFRARRAEGAQLGAGDDAEATLLRRCAPPRARSC